MTDVLAVSADGRITPESPGAHGLESGAALRRLVELVRERTGARTAIQLGHAGRRGATRSRKSGLDRPLRAGAWPLLSASAIPYSPGSAVPKEMDRADMDRVRDDFVRAARVADQAGFDLLQLHFAQGYLLWSFLSPLSNHRTDAWGGSPEKRLAYPLEIVDTVRAAWPMGKPLSVALSATDWSADGLGPDDAVEISRVLKRHGCDLIHVITGLVHFEIAPRYDRYTAMLFSDRVRNEAEIPTMVAARSGTSDEINSILASGRGDLCLLQPLPVDMIPAA
jgi:anthraniloyl-CoA monooxygenase